MIEVVVTTETIRRAKLQSKCHHQQTNIQLLYRLDALPLVPVDFVFGFQGHNIT